MADMADASAGSLLRERDYVLYWCSRAASTLGVQIQTVAMGWQIYDIARRTMSVREAALQVGLIGLVTFLPLLILALPAGETADRYDRKKILLFCYAAEVATGVALFVGRVLSSRVHSLSAMRRARLRRWARLLRSGQHRARPDARLPRASAARHRVELARLADGVHRRTRARRPARRPCAIVGVWRLDWPLSLLDRRAAPYPRVDEAYRASRARAGR